MSTAVRSERPAFVAMPFPGFVRVTCPLPFAGLPHVHVYFARGVQGGIVAFDTSLGLDDSWERIEAALSYVDRSWSDVETIYLTHAHPDHIGLAHRFQEASGAPVVCHAIARDNMEAMQDASRWVAFQDRYREHGFEPQAMTEGRWQIDLPQRIQTVSDGDEVRFASSTWTVHWTPGHEWGHIVFHRPDDAVTLVGDTLLQKITPNISYHGRPEDPLGQFLDSLDLLRRLAPRFVIPMHGRCFEDGRERAMAITSHHQARLRAMVEVLVRDGPMPAVEVSRRVFGRNLMYFQDRLALGETLAHLEYLRLRGRLEREMDDGVWRYAPARPLVG